MNLEEMRPALEANLKQIEDLHAENLRIEQEFILRFLEYLKENELDKVWDGFFGGGGAYLLCETTDAKVITFIESILGRNRDMVGKDIGVGVFNGKAYTRIPAHLCEKYFADLCLNLLNREAAQLDREIEKLKQRKVILETKLMHRLQKKET